MESSVIINDFHTLEGTTLKQKKKSFFLFLKKIENSDCLDDVIQRLEPKTYLEESLKIDFLIYFKKTKDLVLVLTQGNEIGSCKIIKQEWFIKELLAMYPPDKFASELMSCLSFSVRTKILKKILIYIKDEKLVSDLYNNLKKVYGYDTASVLLPGCPSEEIKKALGQNLHKRISVSELKHYFDKDHTIIISYFEQLKKNEQEIDYYKWTPFFNCVAQKNPCLYFDMTEKFSIYKRQLGRQSTKKFIDSRRDKVLDKPEQYMRCFRDDAFVRKLGEDFPKFYAKALPKKLSDFQYCSVKQLLKYYRKSNQYDLYFNTFQEKYEKNLWENTEYMDERLIELIKDKEERDKWIGKFENRSKIKKYKIQPQSCMMSMCRMDFADDEMDYGNTIRERKTIFNTLISTCKLTKDYDAFENILKSFCDRHRNSDVSIVYNFLRTVHKELDMKKFTEEHWKYIFEILSIQMFKKQQIFHPIFMEYIKYLFFQKKSIKETVRLLLNEKPNNLSTFEYKDEIFEKTMLQHYLELLPEIDDEKNILPVQIALAVINWNKKRTGDKISISDQQKIIAVVMKLKDSENVDSNVAKIFKYLVCQQKEGEDVSELDNVYWSNFKKLNNFTITKWFMKYKPLVLKENLDKVGIILKDKNVIVVRHLKKYDHLQIPNTIVSLCMDELKNSEPSKTKRVIRILMFFITLENLLDFMKEYQPKPERIDVTTADEKAQKSYEIQCAVAKYLRLSSYSQKLLENLLDYCQGDVLGSALSSLYSSFYRIPEQQLYPTLEKLNTKAISVRKHSIFLTSIISPQDKVLLKYKQSEVSEKNESIRQHLFLSCFKYFVRNNTPECWPIIESYILVLKKEQKEVLKILTDVRKVPKDYRTKFVEITWKTFEKLKKVDVKLDDNMRSLLDKFSECDIADLSNDFCSGIIDKLFDLDECEMQYDVFNFTKKFLFQEENLEGKINLIFKVIHAFNAKSWSYDKQIEVTKVLKRFCFDLFGYFLNKKEQKININFLRLFRKAWQKEFSMEETFEENNLIDFVSLRMESDFDEEKLPEVMNKTFSSALEKYGTLIIKNYKNFLSSYLRMIFKEDDEKKCFDLRLIEFLDKFLERNSSPNHCALVIELLPFGYLETDATEAFQALVGKLLQKESIIKMYLFGKLKASDY